MDIEAVAEKHPDAIIKEYINIETGTWWLVVEMGKTRSRIGVGVWRFLSDSE